MHSICWKELEEIISPLLNSIFILGSHWLDQRDEASGQRAPDCRRLLDRDRHLEAGVGARGRSSLQHQAVGATRFKNCEPATFDW